MKDAARVATASQTVGPFFHLGLHPQPARQADQAVALTLKVSDGDGEPIEDALIELWTSNAFARVATGRDGTCECEIPRASHINVCFFARGLLRQLHTRIYFATDPAPEVDPVFALVPDARRQTLLACPDPQSPGRWIFHLRLQGSHETVFFDI
jgi:protocatechuate 3,4-dioxygenase, alpha subunit